jgi:glutathione synthase/RimK-type ligase-like ATP-grasp enzyme
MHFFVLGNPENRRVTLFSESYEASGFGKTSILSYLDVLKNNALKETDFSGSILRIESPGENFEVRKLLIAKGAPEAQKLKLPFISVEAAMQLKGDGSEIIHSRQWYLGFKALLNEIGQNLEKYPTARVMNRPSDIALMFNKKDCQQHLKEHGVPVPDFYTSVTGYEQLLELMNVQKLHKVFIKPAHASSASGVIAFRIFGEKQQAVTTIELKKEGDSVRLFNSLRVKTYTDKADIKTIITKILSENAIIEKWISKATIGDYYFDLRVLVIAGQAKHMVVRKSKQVITNLHLGNKRGTLEELEQVIGKEKLEEVKRIAEEAAGCFSGSLYCGVDVLVSADKKDMLVLEINAFGDLLPNVLYQNKSCYGAEIDAMMN